MSKSSLFSLFSVAALSLGLTIPASADTISVASIVTGVLTNGPVTNDFSSGLGSFTAAGSSGIVTGSLLHVYLAPTGDATPYAYASPSGSLTDTLTPGTVNSYGFLWGSADQYNKLTFVTTGGTYIFGPGGTNLDTTITPLYQTNTDAYVTFFDNGGTIESVIFSSTTAAFEIDNVSATLIASPEPTTIALLAGGLLAIGAGAIRRRKS